MTMRKATTTTTMAMATMTTMKMMTMMMAMAMLVVVKRTPTLNASNGYDGREEIDALSGMSESVGSNSNIKMRGERRRRRNRHRHRRRGGRVDVTMRRSRKAQSAGLGIARDVTQKRRRLETGVQQAVGAMAARVAKTRSSRMGRALAWNGAGGPPKVDQPCAGEGEGVAELQGRHLGHTRRGRLDMGCGGGGGGGGGMGEASGAAPAVEAWQQQQQQQERGKKTCDVGEGFRRWQCSVRSPLCGW